jgi:hypothetical protein
MSFCTYTQPIVKPGISQFILVAENDEEFRNLKVLKRMMKIDHDGDRIVFEYETEAVSAYMEAIDKAVVKYGASTKDPQDRMCSFLMGFIHHGLTIGENERYQYGKYKMSGETFESKKFYQSLPEFHRGQMKRVTTVRALVAQQQKEIE